MIRKEIGLEHRIRRAWHTHCTHTKGKLDRNGNPVEFRLTLEQFAEVWLSSGKFDARVVGRGSM